MGMENHIPNFEEHLANIDAGITRFKDRNGREDRIGPQIFPITSPAKMAQYHHFWKFLARKHCFGNN